MASLPFVLAGCSKTSNEYIEPPPVKVTSSRPIQQNVTLFIEQIGQVEPVDNVEIRSRVRGFLEEAKFTAGQEVQAEQPLFLIEPDQYQAEESAAQAAVASANSNISVAKASLENAKVELGRAQNEFERQEKLSKSDATSQTLFDESKAARDSADAAVASAKANIEVANSEKQKAQATLEQAQLNLRYTIVTAEIGGNITKTDVKIGNLVDAGTILARIVDYRKMFINFSIADRTVLELMNEFDERESEPRGPEAWKTVPVYLRRDTDKKWTQGQLEYVDQTGFSEMTGTLTLRAEIDNAERNFLPGMFVTVRMPRGRYENALLVPEQAVTRSSQGDFVMLINKEKKVEQRFITIGQRLDGWALVESGLEPTDEFVVDGLQRVRPGAEVESEPTQLSTESSPMLSAAITLAKELDSNPNLKRGQAEDNPDENSGGQPQTPEPVEVPQNREEQKQNQ